jgi:4-diphosphocytidyl-2-C-methyl-D-erythritol kinase
MTLMKIKAFAPAKVNRFLHIIGRRSDGYHELQTIFERINYGDTLDFSLRDDSEIGFVVKNDSEALKVPVFDLDNDKNLVVRAANLLRAFAKADEKGVDILLLKKIPIGAGLGGGSSDAATTLLALNRLWNLNLSKAQLAEIGLQLGADVPFFILEQSAWGEGIGEKLTPIFLEPSWFLVVVPQASIATQAIFTDPQLTCDTPPCKLDLSLVETGHNDCEAVARRLSPEVGEVIDTLAEFTKPQMTGTGSCVFAVFETKEAISEVILKLPKSWRYFIAETFTK